MDGLASALPFNFHLHKIQNMVWYQLKPQLQGNYCKTVNQNCTTVIGMANTSIECYLCETEILACTKLFRYTLMEDKS